ncbi:MAG: alpha/beta hydrolase [Microcoleus sp. SM1_3_4]|nr:alpha/beta hydrolase [Microcoleus sp. SM1_3_4]
MGEWERGESGRGGEMESGRVVEFSNYQLPITNYQFPITNSQFPTINYFIPDCTRQSDA